jgi:hypothetical protein
MFFPNDRGMRDSVAISRQAPPPIKTAANHPGKN